MAILFNVINDVESSFGLDVACLRTLTKGYAVHDIATLAIHKFQFYMLLIAPNHLAGAVVIDLTGAEEGFVVVRTIGSEAFQVGCDATIDVTEVDDGIDTQDGISLLGLDMLPDILLEAMPESRDIPGFSRPDDSVHPASCQKREEIPG